MLRLGFLKVAKWEIIRSSSGMKPSYLGISFFLILLLLFFSSLGLQPNQGIYTIAITDNEEIAYAASEDGRFEVLLVGEDEGSLLLDAGKTDLHVIKDEIHFHPARKTDAALSALEQAYRSYRVKSLAESEDPGAFPVWITLHYVKREYKYTFGYREVAEQEVEVKEEKVEMEKKEKMEIKAREEVEILERVLPREERVPPSQLVPPLPFGPIFLSFFFLFPLYFFVQFYSASVFRERLQRRGELLLVSPLRREELILGKLLVYLLPSIFVTALISIYFNPDFLPLLLSFLPVIFFFLSFSFLSGILARSYKELTFFSIFLVGTASIYLFLPTLFLNVHTISIISPLTLLVRGIEGEAFTVSEYIFSTLPLYLLSLLLFLFGWLIYKEEILFSELPLHVKIMEIFRSILPSIPVLALLIMGILLVPLAYIGELIFLSLFFSLPINLSLPAIIFSAALIEEGVKSIGLFSKLTEKRLKTVLRYSFFLSLGFFLGEKFVLVAAFPLLESIYGGIFFGGLLIFPLLAHFLFTSILGMSRICGMKFYPLFLLFATLSHSIYNFQLLRYVWI